MPAAVRSAPCSSSFGSFLSHSERERAHLGLFGIGAGDLPVPAGQRQFEQRLAERLELMVGRLVGRCDFGDQGAQIEVEPAVEGALGGVAIDRRQHDAGDEQDHHHPGGRRQEQPGGERTGAHQSMIPKRMSPGRGPMDGCRFSDKIMLEQESKTAALINTLDQLPGVGGVSR